MGIPMPVESVVHEVDLSDEWAALSEQLETAMKEEETPSAAQQAAPRQEDVQVHAPVLVPADVSPMQAQSAANAPDFDLPVQPVAPHGVTESDTLAADTLFADLAGDLDTFTSSMGITEEPAQPAMQNSAAPVVHRLRPQCGRNRETALPRPCPLCRWTARWATYSRNSAPSLAKPRKTKTSRPITTWESPTEKWDCSRKPSANSKKWPARRTKGLLSVMPCNVVRCWAWHLWRKGSRPLRPSGTNELSKTPGLDQESILALRYDLGVAQELAGDTHAAFSSFSQVYAMNIDYRDVSERIALLGKAR